MGVIVVGDVAHVVVDVMLELEMHRHHHLELRMHVCLHVIGRRGIVFTPHHHRHCADLAFGNPTHVVLMEPWRDSGGFAEIAIRRCHRCTCSRWQRSAEGYLRPKPSALEGDRGAHFGHVFADRFGSAVHEPPHDAGALDDTVGHHARLAGLSGV